MRVIIFLAALVTEKKKGKNIAIENVSRATYLNSSYIHTVPHIRFDSFSARCIWMRFLGIIPNQLVIKVKMLLMCGGRILTCSSSPWDFLIDRKRMRSGRVFSNLVREWIFNAFQLCVSFCFNFNPWNNMPDDCDTSHCQLLERGCELMCMCVIVCVWALKRKGRINKENGEWHR